LTPLHHAIFSTPEIFEIILSKTSDRSAKNMFGDTPLDLETAILRLTENTDLNTQNSDRCCALFFALNSENPSTVKLLIDHIDPLWKTEQGQNLLHLVSGKFPENYFVMVLEKFLDIDNQDIYGYTALSHAVRDGREDHCIKLIQKGANVHLESTKKHTPLHIAVMTNNVSICKLLVDNGADIRTKDNTGATPLDYAKKANNHKLVAILLQK